MNNCLCFLLNASMNPKLNSPIIMMAILQVKGNSCHCEFNLQHGFHLLTVILPVIVKIIIL